MGLLRQVFGPSRLEPDRWVVVNSERKWESVQEELRKVIEGRIIT